MKRRTLLPLVQTALFAACLAVLSPLALPIGPVPITPGTLAVLFAALTLGAARGSLAVLVYLCKCVNESHSVGIVAKSKKSARIGEKEVYALGGYKVLGYGLTR
jgi:hypothetical protein